MNIRIFLTLLLISFIQIATAQNTFTISGNVEREDKKKLFEATIELLKNKNVVTATVSDRNGAFILNNISNGTYTLVVKLTGYTSIEAPITMNNKNLTPPTFVLKEKKETIDEVKVTAAKPVAKFSTDKKTYNVGQDITATGGSAADVLKNVPSLQVDPIEGNVSIRGNDNITLLIDGKPSVMFGTDVAEALRSIPASSIESVEVITNPGAQYDAQGKGGVLNIILKKDRKAGYNGNFGVTTGLPYRLNINLGLNANIKKWNFFINANGRTARNIIKESTIRTSVLTALRNENNNENFRRPQSGFVNFGADYTINKFNKVSLSQSFFGANMLGDIESQILGFNNNLVTNTTIRNNVYTGNPRNGTTTFGYVKTFKRKEMQLKADGSVGISRYQRISDFVTDSFDANNVLIVNDFRQSLPVKGGNNNITLSTDFTTPLNDKTKFDIGLKTIQFNFRSENFPTKTSLGGPTEIDIPLKNKFEFDQKTYAAYTNFKQRFGKFGYQVGLRLEHFRYDGFVYQFNLPTQAQFTNLFPSVYAGYKLKDESEISINYTKRTNRPNFFQLIPYLDVTNPLDTNLGNANLRPEFIHAVEAGYSKMFNNKHSFLTTVYYQLNNNLIQRYKRFNNNGTTLSQTINLNSGETYGAESSLKYIFSKQIEASVNGNIFYNKINGNEIDATINRQGWAGFAKFIGNYKFAKKYDLQLSSNYNSKTPIAQGYIEPYYNLDAALKTSFLKGNALTVTLGANDIFNTVQQISHFDIPGVSTQQSYKKLQTRQVTIGAQFRFLSKSTKPSDVKPFNPGKKSDTKDVKNRDENLKKDEGGDEGGGPPQQNK